MKTIILTIFSLSFGLLGSIGQTLNKEYIDNWVLKTYPNFQIDNKVVYVLNGLPYTSDTLDTVLVKYQQTDLTTIIYLDKNEIQNVNLCGPATGMILLCTKGKQSKESIAKDLKRVKELYKKPDLRTTGDIDIGKKEPVLVIDGNQIIFRDNYDTLQKLKTNEIIGINYIEKPVSEELYGTNAINGLIIITTKKPNR
jgi:hypothetical protein